MLSRMNLADSNSSWVVFSVISLFRPPMMPASATGFAPSQMTRLLSFSWNSLPSRVTMDSSLRARRTMIWVLSSVDMSKACMGWPISSITKLVMSTTLLMLRRPHRAR